MTEPTASRDASSVPYGALAAAGALLAALGQTAAIGIGGCALWEGMLYLTGRTCPMGAFGASLKAMMVLLFVDPPVLLATVLVLWLARRQLPRWARAGLRLGLGTAILIPLAALAASA
jgi:hypothetical protein